MRHKAVFLLALLASAPALARTIRWPAIHVNASVDADGVLHVEERQTILFDGDWNGGERSFDIRPGQWIEMHGMRRVEGGEQIKMIGNHGLAEVDRWSHAGNHVYRWRSRLASDPPFENKELTYILDYSMGNVLIDRGGGTYLLNHDFAFPKRDGAIEHFSVHLQFDPIWGVTAPLTYERTNVPPGAGVVVRQELKYRGAGAPSQVAKKPPQWPGVLGTILFGGSLVWLIRRFVDDERGTGRFTKLTPAAEIDERWLEEHLFALPPEVAGAVWDGDIGAPEVAATLARMTHEGKLSSAVHAGTLHLELLVDRDTLDGAERALVRKLFFSGNKTDTNRIHRNYQNTGFNPATEISPFLTQQLEQLPHWNEKVARVPVATDLVLLGAGIVLLIVATAIGPETVIGTGILGLIFGIVAWLGAAFARKAVVGYEGRLAVVFIPCLALAASVLMQCVLGAIQGIYWLAPFAIGLFAFAVIKLALDIAKCPDSPAKIAYRKRVAAAREYFMTQLASPQPNLRDEWYPYLLAFGLGTHVDHWFRRFGAAPAASSSSSHSWTSSSSSSSSSSSGSSWSGGGGAFGGAGATGTWAVAAAGMAAGVSPPGSSSSGGGGGGSSSSSGGSSGGGGGGGW